MNMKRSVAAVQCVVAAGVLIGLITACGASTNGAAQPAFTPSNVRFTAGCSSTEPEVASEFTLSCDSSTVVKNVTWTTWNKSQAIGTGMLGFDNCEPDCATGKYTYYQVSIQFANPVPAKCGLVWGDAAFIFHSTPPADLTVAQRGGKPAMVVTTKPNDPLSC
jgi:hypothetical protein